MGRESGAALSGVIHCTVPNDHATADAALLALVPSDPAREPRRQAPRATGSDPANRGSCAQPLVKPSAAPGWVPCLRA